MDEKQGDGGGPVGGGGMKAKTTSKLPTVDKKAEQTFDAALVQIAIFSGKVITNPNPACKVIFILLHLKPQYAFIIPWAATRQGS